MIDRFVSIITWTTFAILLGLIYSRFFSIGSYGVVLCCYLGRFCFSFKVSIFLATSWIFSCEMLFISRLKAPIELFFFQFLFSSHCHSVGHRVVSIVFDSCNQSSFMFFYVVLESLYRSVNTVFNAGKSSFSLISWNISLSTSSLGCNALCMVINFFVLWSICLNSSLVHFKRAPNILRGIYSFDKIFAKQFCLD